MPGTPYNYMGTWNASSGLPPATSPSVGDVYLVTTAGHNTLNSGTIYAISEWYVGDQAVFLSDVSPAGENWYKLDGINRDIPSILDWGADPTGATDSTAAINNAIAFVLAAGGGDLLFPIGDYLHTNRLEILGTGGFGYIRLIAVGDRSSSPTATRGARLLCSSATADHLFINNCESVEVDGLGFFPSPGTVPTAGWGIHVRRGQRVTIRNFIISGAYNGLLVESVAVPTIENGYIEDLVGTDGLRVSGDIGTISQGRVDHLSINPGMGEIPTNCTGITVEDRVNSITWTNVHVSYATLGFALGTNSGIESNRPRLHRFYDLSIEYCGTGAQFVDGSFCWFNNISVLSNTNSGVVVDATMDLIIGTNAYGGPIFFDNPFISANGQHGVQLNGCPLIYFKGGVIAGNATAGMFDGVHVTSPTAYFSIIGTRTGGDSSGLPGTVGNQEYGINITSAVTAPSFVIDNVNGLGNQVGALFDGSSATANKIIGSILGFNKTATSLPNILVNGAFQVWQRGTSFSLGAAAPCADYWVCTRSGGGGGTLSQQSSGPLESPYSARLQRPSGDTATNSLYLVQVLTTADSLPFVGTQIILAFYARAGVDFSGGTLQSCIILGAGIDQTASQAVGSAWLNQTTSVEFNTLSGAWQLFTVAITVPAMIGSPAMPTSQIAIEFYYTPSGTAGTHDYVDIGLVSLQSGYGPPVREVSPYWLELEAAQQRFRKSFPDETAPVQSAGLAGAAYFWLSTGLSGNFGIDIPLLPPMRATPTVITYNPSANNANWRDNTNNADRAVGTTMDVASSGFHLDGSGGVAASANYIHWTADAELT